MVDDLDSWGGDGGSGGGVFVHVCVGNPGAPVGAKRGGVTAVAAVVAPYVFARPLGHWEVFFWNTVTHRPVHGRMFERCRLCRVC